MAPLRVSPSPDKAGLGSLVHRLRAGALTSAVPLQILRTLFLPPVPAVVDGSHRGYRG